MAGEEHLSDGAGGHTWMIAASFMALFVILLLGVALFSSALATTAFAGLSWGHLLVFVLHVLPVAAAWLYIRSGS